MDEVDGMSGGDRGGVGQMAALCRETCIPIILICNDRSLPKMRPLIGSLTRFHSDDQTPMLLESEL